MRWNVLDERAADIMASAQQCTMASACCVVGICRHEAEQEGRVRP